MPSSGAPHDYVRRPRRFFYTGLSLTPQDALPDGKVAYIRNMRSYQEGTLTVRDGTQPLVTGLGGAIHTLVRLNDSTPAASASPEIRLIGVGGTVARNVVGASMAAAVASGFSGDPLTAIVATPTWATSPYVYLGDASQQRKINHAGTAYTLGVNAPATPPTAVLAAPQRTALQDAASGFWTSYGGQSAPVAPTFTPVTSRVATTVAQYLPDGVEPGMASFVLESFDNVVTGMLLTLGAETCIVHAIHPPVSPTTIAGILYDSGTTGWCTIQPTGGFEAGQTEPVDTEVIQHRYTNLTTPIPPKLTVTRTVDFPVDSLVQLNGGEIVRIASVSVGTDGVTAFRCQTLGTYAAGATITGLASLRAYVTGAHAIAEAVTASQTTVTITATDLETPVVGGFQTAIAPPAAWGRIGARASAPDDLIRINIRISQMGYVEGVRLMLDLKPDPTMASEPYTSDYLFYEWRASDLVAAIQAQTEIATQNIVDSQSVAVQRGQTETQYIDQFGNQSGPFVPAPGTAGRHRPRNPGPAGSPGSGRTGRFALNRDGSVPMSHGISRQLALGNNVWMTLECRMSDLTRVGTDTTLTLQGIENAAIYLQSKGWIEPITFDIGDAYVTGGYGPDAGVTLPPYVYRYRYRSTTTGERSNPSPPMRAGVTPRRQRVSLTVTPSTAAQIDVIDLYRFGGALARWTYVGTIGNSAPTYNDDTADPQIDGGETLELDRYACWPVAGAPASGTCTVAGTSVVWVSGDAFDTAWPADTLVTINGRTTTLYAPPSAATRLELADNVGEGTAVAFSVPSPIRMQTPLPAIWGGAFNNVWFHFACGSTRDPGVLYWSNGNDPDSASDTNFLRVTTASEPLMGGYFDDGQCYVFSTNRLFRIVPTFGDPTTPFRVVETACTKGLWSRWAFCVSPFGTFFLAADGIYLTAGGSEALPIIDPDLRVLFPQDGGGEPETIRGIVPPDMAVPHGLRLAFVDNYLYFDFQDLDGTFRTLVYEPLYKRWSHDVYPSAYSGARVRLQEPGQADRQHLIGTGAGVVYDVRSDQITDDVHTLPWAVWTPWEHGDDPRANKQWGDAVLDAHPGGALGGITCTPVTANGNLLHDPTTVGIEGTYRDTFQIEINDGIGPWARNFGLQISGTCETCDDQRPLLYLWEPSFLHKGIIVGRRATDWDDLGYKGAKYVQGIMIRANTFGADKCVAVEYDSPNGDPTTALILTLNHDGEQTKAYPIDAEGWAPFVGELVRLRGVDDEEWTLLDWRWVWEPAPEAATQWETQETTFDAPGYLTVHDGVIAYAAPAQVTLTIWHDAVSTSYTLPATTNGAYARQYLRCVAAKGKAVKFRWTSTQPFRLFKRDCALRVQPWGQLGGYLVQSPFGGPHRVDGAGI